MSVWGRTDVETPDAARRAPTSPLAPRPNSLSTSRLSSESELNHIVSMASGPYAPFAAAVAVIALHLRHPPAPLLSGSVQFVGITVRHDDASTSTTNPTRLFVTADQTDSGASLFWAASWFSLLRASLSRIFVLLCWPHWQRSGRVRAGEVVRVAPITTRASSGPPHDRRITASWRRYCSEALSVITARPSLCERRGVVW